MTDLVSAAHGYLAAGFSVIALVGKLPNVDFHPHGLKNALKGVPAPGDQRLIEDVFGAPATTGLAIVLEYPYFVVDVDGESGARIFADMLGSTDVGDAPVARTGRGLHVWFADLFDRPSMKLAEKLDIKGQGGYVVVPPSRHPDGHLYEWLNPLVSDAGLNAPMEMPDAMRDWLRRRQVSLDRFAPTFEREVGLRPVFNRDGSWQVEMAPASITGLVNHVRGLVEGNRNDGLHWAACRAHDDGLTLEEAFAGLVPAAITVGLDAQEARRTIRSAYRGTR